MTDSPVSTQKQWQRKLDIFLHRSRRLMPVIEVSTLVLVIVIGIATFGAISASSNTKPLAPITMALMLIANLLPAVTLIVLIGRRVAQGRAARSPIGGRGRLHVRLLALFSLIATIPMLFMVIFASLLFQYGVEIWYTDRARSMFENTVVLSQQLYAEKQQRVLGETEAMAIDVGSGLSEAAIDSSAFVNFFLNQVYRRELSEGAVLAISAKNGVQTLAVINPYKRPTEGWIPPDIANKLIKDRQPIFRDTGSRMEAVTPIPNSRDLFIYGSRVADTETLSKAKRAETVLKSYNALIGQSRSLQLRFNVALYLITLAIVGAAVLIALNVADRLVRPVSDLVSAARRVAAGDLTARVLGRKSRDEVGTLTNAFNRMTGRLKQQTEELVSANVLLDRRRALIEAVLSGVTAGVIAVDGDQNIRIMNSSAQAMLKVGNEGVAGRSLISVSPELSEMLSNDLRDAILQVSPADEARTLAVKIVRDEAGHVLTFDDITQQQLDQRRAAWSDVARRVAHEIKNPLTPIQLASERLQRRFGKEITSDPATFARLTETISRQVGDLRRMVDEFSSFARMPKPVFGEDSLVDIAREAMFLHEVANPNIKFVCEAPNPPPRIICDRRQLAQALSNVVKNGVEAIQPKLTGKKIPQQEIRLTIEDKAKGKIIITITDTGIGLPVERDRIVEPYMTTRAGGTGLGLAIVKKIIEEHGGEIQFSDRKGGGAVVTISLLPTKLAEFAESGLSHEMASNESLPSGLTRVESR